MSVVTAKWTLDDYHRMIAAGILVDRRVELLNGEIIEMPPEGPEHAQLSTDGADYLRSLLGQQALIREAKPITIPTLASEPEPDIAIVVPQRSLYLTQHPHPEQIFWVMEYAYSSLSKDLEIKRQIYAAAGIPEYWIVNLKQRWIKILRDPREGDYQVDETISQGELYPLAFPDLQISAQRLLGT